ncbi:hypothetical protein COO59_18200 [Mixta theicola]|uniref:Type VI secretion system-associated protein n=1 Tax=Mixta theicola TaxID=1458355 RepID=A0A2K1Q5J2_9GAMM|nr:hypothetical protein [Mixta theicola]PNS10300.1 hypothetical protein COO59_18200 [Mixta theicola]GLR09534.1 hypothetical protein GCM10007905_22540 [Mixta theicola]
MTRDALLRCQNALRAGREAVKYWLPGFIALLMASAANAENYRVVYSPSMALEVFIDNVASNAPQDWCKDTLHLRIVSGESKDSTVLTTFLPRVGTLLANQCGKLQELPWEMMDNQGAALASGTAVKAQNWRPIVTADATATANANNAAPLDLSRPANSEPLQHFELPGGCHFRTWWDDNGQSLFIPDNRNLSCSTEGWLEGASELTLVSDGKSEPVAVNFWQGYPLIGLKPDSATLSVVNINNQRMVVTNASAEESWLILPFDNHRHVWQFSGTLLVKMDKGAAQDLTAVRARVNAVRKAWSGMLPAKQKITVMLVDALHPDLADPAIGAYRTLN